jgi:hypothetical protein
MFIQYKVSRCHMNCLIQGTESRAAMLERGGLIVRQLCLHLGAERVFLELGEMHMRVYKYVYPHACLYVRVYMYACACIYTYTHVCICTQNF